MCVDKRKEHYVFKITVPSGKFLTYSNMLLAHDTIFNANAFCLLTYLEVIYLLSNLAA